MKLKKLCAILLASSMVLSLAACGGSGSEPKQDTAAEDTKEPEEANTDTADAAVEESGEDTAGDEASADASGGTGSSEENYYGGLVPMDDADDPITYTFFVRDPGVVPADNNPVIQKITELTGVTIKFEFLVGDLDQKLGVMIAGGDYPDVIFAGDAGSKLRDAGAFIPLEEEIPKYPNLNAMYGNVLKYLTQADGHVYDMEIYGTFQNDVK